MRNLIYLCVLCTLFMFSCSNDDDGLPQPTLPKNEMVAVSFNTSIFTEEQVPISSRSSDISDVYMDSIRLGLAKSRKTIGHLLYVVYDAESKNYIKHKELRTYYFKETITQLTDTLNKGKYLIVFWGATTYSTAHMDMTKITNNYDQIEWNHIASQSGHTYLSTFELDTNSTNSTLEKAVYLKRMTGELEIYFNDAAKLPINISDFVVKISYKPTRIKIDESLSGEGNTTMNLLPLTLQPFTFSKIPFPFQDIHRIALQAWHLPLAILPNDHLNEAERGTITFTFTSSDGQIIEKMIPLPTIYANTITKLRGNIFDSNDVSFNIEVENEIGEVINEVEF